MSLIPQITPEWTGQMIGCMSRGSLRTTAMQFYRLTLRSVALFYVGVRWKFSCSTEIREIYEKWPCGSLPQDNGRNSLSSSSAGCQSSLTLEEIPGHSAKTRVWRRLCKPCLHGLCGEVQGCPRAMLWSYFPGLPVFSSVFFLLLSAPQSMWQKVFPNSSWAYMLLISVERARDWFSIFQF